jgi:membrane protein implicated in regulation of membrane protease activity
MTLVFVICAVGGGTVMVLQFVLLLMGIGGDDSDSGGGHDFGGDAGHDFGGDHDFSGDAGHDMGGDVHADDFHPGDADAQGETIHDAHAHQLDHHGSTGFFKILSFRAIIAALAFFGIGGLAAESAKFSAPATLAIALASAVAAIYLVYWLMKLLYSFNAEGTARIDGAVGKFGTVYLRIPAQESGSGKIQLNLQNQTMEYLATTAGPEIPTGTTIEVVGITSPTTLSVERAESPERDKE